MSLDTWLQVEAIRRLDRDQRTGTARTLLARVATTREQSAKDRTYTTETYTREIQEWHLVKDAHPAGQSRKPVFRPGQRYLAKCITGRRKNHDVVGVAASLNRFTAWAPTTDLALDRLLAKVVGRE